MQCYSFVKKNRPVPKPVTPLVVLGQRGDGPGRGRRAYLRALRVVAHVRVRVRPAHAAQRREARAAQRHLRGRGVSSPWPPRGARRAAAEGLPG